MPKICQNSRIGQKLVTIGKRNTLYTYVIFTFNCQNPAIIQRLIHGVKSSVHHSPEINSAHFSTHGTSLPESRHDRYLL